jgi:hypothetical protein
VTQTVPTKEKIATHAALFRLMLDGEATYFVMADRENAVHGFESMRQGLDFFERAYHQGLARGWGWSAGAMLNWMQLQPRVFRFGTVAKLHKLLGKTVHPYKITATGVFEFGFKCKDQKAAAKLYEESTEARLTPA